MNPTPHVDTPWTVPPIDSGQTVEFSYAACWEDGLLYRRVYDRTHGALAFFVADATTLVGEWEPQNVPPTITGSWTFCDFCRE